MPNRRVLFVLAAILCVAPCAAATNVVTGVTADRSVIGNSNETGVVTVTVSCDPGVSSVNLYVWTDGGVYSGPVRFYNSVWTVPCETYQASFFVWYEVPIETAYEVRACVVGWNGFCAHEPVVGSVTVLPARYTVTPLATSVRVSRSPAPRTFMYPVNLVYGIADPACQHPVTVFGALVLQASALPPTGSVPIYNCGGTWGVAGGFWVADVQRPAPPPPTASLRLRASLDGVTYVPSQGVALPATAHMPLGTILDLRAFDQNGVSVPASFQLNTASLAAGVATSALFKDQALIRFTATAANAAEFAAVHKGTVTITIRPADTTIAAGTLTISVEDTSPLGETNNDLDAEIYKVAHRYGILPEFVKAHAWKESGFDRIAYRYEPVGPWSGDLLRVSREDNLRVTPVFEDYRLATRRDSVNAALAEGALLTAADRDVRDVLHIKCATIKGGRPIVATDVHVSAQEIFTCNDGTMNWQKKAGADGPARVARLMSDPFTAQTNLAASFGLLQVTYPVAILEVFWKGDVDGNRNPSLLLDTAEVHARNGGSLDVGTHKMQMHFRRATRGVTIETSDDLIAGMIKAWHRYNSGETNYGGRIAVKVPSYMPIPVLPVLGGSQ